MIISTEVFTSATESKSEKNNTKTRKRWFLVSLGNTSNSVQSSLHIDFYIKFESNTNYAFETELSYNILQGGSAFKQRLWHLRIAQWQGVELRLVWHWVR